MTDQPLSDLTQAQHDRVYRAMTENQLQTQVLALARYYGWETYHTHDSRRSNAGWPDLVLIKVPRVLFIELKSFRGSLRPEQRGWLYQLRECGCEVTVWRPPDIDGAVVRALGPKQERLTWNGAT